MALVRKALIVTLAGVVLALGATLAVSSTLEDPVVWTPDALFYQVRLLEVRGVPHDEAVQRVFEGPLSRELRARDPHHSGSADWVAYNEPFYERRVALPIVGAVVYPLAGNRSLLYVSLAGFAASIVALFGLLLLRFSVAIAAAVATATIVLPPLRSHSSFPLTDSWGLALEIAALAAAVVVLDRGRRWLLPWIAAVALLGVTRDTTWVLIGAAAWCAFRYRSRIGALLVATGVAAALPALLFFEVPVRSLLALLVNDSEVSTDTSWAFIASHYPAAVLELLRSDAGFLRRGEWYTAAYFVLGIVALFVLVRRRPDRLGPPGALLTAGAVLGGLYVLAAPVFSAFRLELVLVPMAAFGLALALEGLVAHVRVRVLERSVAPAAAPVPAEHGLRTARGRR